MKQNAIRSKRSPGFTLLELLLVVIVVGILAALALPQYIGFAEKSRAAEALATMGAIKNAELAVKLESSAFTGNISNLSVKAPTTGNATYWVYSLSDASADAFTVTATRTNKKAGDALNQTIVMGWNDTSSPPESWSGNHSGVPR